MGAVVLGIFLSLLKMEKIKEIFNLFMHNVEKWPNTLKILQCEHRKIFKVCLAIFQHYT